MKKTITGICLFVGLMGFIFLTEITRYVFDGLILLFTAFSTYEMIKVGKEKGYNPTVIPLCIIIAGAYPMMWFFHIEGLMMTLGVGFVLVFSFFIFDSKVNFHDFLYSLLVMIYPLTLMLITLYLLMKYDMIPLLIALGAAMCSDTLAFYFGSLIKGPKIFPKISPKKTFSGCAFGLIGGSVGALLVYALFELAKLPVADSYRFTDALGSSGMAILFYALIGLGIAVVSEIGDLGASRIKREMEIKDFSRAFGSHGGIMDRLDSIVFAVIFMAIVMYFMPAMSAVV